ncbi:MAG TPA: hypothetical protein VIJ27_07095 [Mucilaginibacter sp.]
MKYLKWALIILVSICSNAYCGYSQINPLQQKSIISTKIVALRFDSQTDTLWIPDVPDKYPALKRALSYKNIFDGDDLADVIKNYQSCGCGITRLDYEITFESEGILSIILYFETMSAYPDDYQKYLTYNISTGKVYPIANEINPKGLKWMVDYYKTTLRKRIIYDKATNEDESNDIYNELKTAIDSVKSDDLFENYIFKQEGVFISMDKILPHVLNAIEPDRDLLIPYNKLKNFKAPGAMVLK